MLAKQQEQDVLTGRMDSASALVGRTRQPYATPQLVCYGDDLKPTAGMQEVKTKLLEVAAERVKPK